MAKKSPDTLREELVVLVESVMGTCENPLADNCSFVDDLGMDDLDFIEFIMAVEEKYGLSIDDGVAQALTTAETMLAYIRSKTMITDEMVREAYGKVASEDGWTEEAHRWMDDVMMLPEIQALFKGTAATLRARMAETQTESLQPCVDLVQIIAAPYLAIGYNLGKASQKIQ